MWNPFMSTFPIKKTRRWIWYFALLFALAFLATVVLIVYNLRQQLKPEQLVAARALWKESGPANYTMSYTTRVNEEAPDHYWAKVRVGKVVDAQYNGQSEPPERRAYRSMEGLFDFIEKFMQIDNEPGNPKTYVRAIFDDQKTGGVRWYVRRVMGSRQRVEITVDKFSIDSP
jgi:hypothetical protein